MGKKILLVNPWITDFAAYDFWLRPLGLLSLAAFLKSSGFDVSYIDCLDRFHPSTGAHRGDMRPDGSGHFHKTEIRKPAALSFVPRRFSRYGIPREAFEAALDGMDAPDAAMVTSSMTYWYPGAFEAIGLIKRRWPGVPVVLGGRYATLCADHARANSGADIVVEGAWQAARTAVAGVIDGLPDFPAGFKATPFPAHELPRDHSVAAYSFSRGCPFRCTYCASHRLYHGFEQRGADEAVEEIRIIAEELGAKHVAFYDDALLVNAEKLLVPVLEHVIRKEYGLKFYTPNAMHAGLVNAEIAVLMRRAGFTEARLGLESAEPSFQHDTGGKVDNTGFVTAAKHLRDAGFRPPHLAAYVLAGHPAQSTGQVRDTINFAARHGVEPVLAEYSPIPGSIDFPLAVESFNHPPDSDPLLQNSSLIQYQHPRISTEDFRSLKMECRDLRLKVRKTGYN